MHKRTVRLLFLGTAAVGATGIMLLARLTAGDTLPAMDLASTQRAVNAEAAWLDRLFIVATSMADPVVLTVTDIMIVGSLLAFHRWRFGFICGSVFVGCATAVQLVKFGVQRARPIGDLYEGLSAFSFPSGHTANATATLLVIAYLLRCTLQTSAWRWTASLLLTAACLIGASRIYLGAHWTSDVLAGFLITSTIVAIAGQFLEQKPQPLPPQLAWSPLLVWTAVGILYTSLMYSQQLMMYERN